MRTETAEFYEDDSFGDRWRWRLIAPNGVIIGASSEAYRDRRDALVNFRSVTRRELKFVAVRGKFTSETA